VAVLAVVAGWSFYQADHYARLDAARADAVKQGEGAVGRLLSYSFRTSDRQVEKTQDLVTGSSRTTTPSSSPPGSCRARGPAGQTSNLGGSQRGRLEQPQ